ncbi:glutamic acid-rich protein-like [Cucurbita moschata]|uniref:Glutamic acid-rich protein-like n=1 Tax=Cucurbita moschata TaxID=3662 RepID=A0A6J1EWD4_CUCMO|nr:glutamic acid-rich protein-like [Cucurbita moschata]XP_022932336.1 glutamic acid-rich protein-like [Cucurbita moschata]XP_022932337.1 glutamic acid-rich protein-like [Cucurbita moschata]
MGEEDTTKNTIEKTKNEASGEDLKTNTSETMENGNNKEDKMKSIVETMENGTTEDDKMTNTVETVTKGTSELEKTNETLPKREENGVKEPEIEQGAGVKAEVMKMEEEPKIKDDEEINGEKAKDKKEEAKVQAVEENVNPNDKKSEQSMDIENEGNEDVKDGENEDVKDEVTEDAKDERTEDAKDEGPESAMDEKTEDAKAETEDTKDKVEKVDSQMEEDDKELKDKDPNEGKPNKRRKRTGVAKSKGKNEEDEKEEAEIRTPIIDRPVRERKSVERLVASIERHSVKEFQIEKGRGTPLKDIPNVAFKLSRKKADDTFRLLHSIIFGRRGKAFQIKSNISRFSGFVWHGDEEKQKSKVKEKIDKCNKEKLLELCDVLDIPVVKATTRKEDIVGKLIEFLIAPHATTTVLTEKEKSSNGKKRKRAVKGEMSTPGDNSSKHSPKSRRKRGNTARSELTKNSSDEDDELEEKEAEEENDKENEDGITEKSDDEMSEQPKSEDINDPTDESEEEKPKSSSKSSSRTRGSVRKARSKKAIGSNKSDSAKLTAKRTSSSLAKVDDSDASPKVFSRKKNSEKVSKASTPSKSAAKEKPGKKIIKGKDKTKEEKTRPSDDELREAICEILKVVDFTTATFTDILKQLARQFKTDLTSQKSSIKLMIQEELTKLADEAEEEDGNANADTEKDGKQVAQEVET